VVNPLELNVVNAPVDAAVEPIAPGEANVAPLNEDAFKLATLVVDATVNGAVPVAMVEVTVVKRPVEAVVAPIEVLLMVDAVVGLIVNAPAGLIATVPVPVGLIVIAALDPLKPTVELADSVVNAPVLAAVDPIGPGEANLSLNPVPDTDVLADSVVNAPVTAPVTPTLPSKDVALILPTVNNDQRFVMVVLVPAMGGP